MNHAPSPAQPFRLRLTIPEALVRVHLEFIVQDCPYSAIEPTLALAMVTRQRAQTQIIHWQCPDGYALRLSRAVLAFEADWVVLLAAAPAAVVAITATKGLICAVPAHWLEQGEAHPPSRAVFDPLKDSDTITRAPLAWDA